MSVTLQRGSCTNRSREEGYELLAENGTRGRGSTRWVRIVGLAYQYRFWRTISSEKVGGVGRAVPRTKERAEVVGCELVDWCVIEGR